MATKKKEELTQEEMPLTLDTDMPLDGQEDDGPPEDEDAAGLAAADADGQPSDAVPAADSSGTEVDAPIHGGADAESAALEIPAREQIFVPMPEQPVEETAAASDPPAEPPAPAKPKRAPRKKKAAAAKSEPQTEADSSTTAPPAATSVEQEPAAPANTGTTPAPRPRPARQAQPTILTIESGGAVETEADREDVIWHEIHNAYRVCRVLSGLFCGVSRPTAKRSLLWTTRGSGS